MRLPVLLALGAPEWEARLVAAIARPESGFTVVRRCVDLPELLSAAATRPGGCALVSEALPRLDRAAVARCRERGLLMVGVHAATDPAAAERLLGLGVDRVLEVDDDAAGAAAALAALADQRRPHLVPVEGPAVRRGSGRIIAVWGPPGAPGRSSVALALADESARAGVETLLVDADAVAPSLTALLGLCDDVPTLAAAVRRAERGGLGATGLAEACVRLAPGLRLLGGGPASSAAVARSGAAAEVWAAATELAGLTVVDAGPQDLVAGVIEVADVLVAVGSADPIGLARLVTSLPTATAAAPGAELRVVVNRVRRSAVGPNPEQAVREALTEHGIEGAWLVPDDRPAFDAAVLAGRTIAEVAPGSAARKALAALAAQLVPVAAPRSSGGRLVGRLGHLNAG